MLFAETCFPVEVMHGHIRDLLEKGADHIFLPFIVDNRAEDGNPTVNYNCPWIQASAFMLRGVMKDEAGKARLLMPTLHFRYSRRQLLSELAGFMNDAFGTSAAAVRSAVDAAEQAQGSFEHALQEEGRRILESLPAGKIPVVILGRPYNAGDPELNLGLIAKLIDLGDNQHLTATFSQSLSSAFDLLIDQEAP